MGAHRKKWLLILFIIFHCTWTYRISDDVETNSSRIQRIGEDEKIDYRLPKTIVPEHYEIILSPNLDEDDFSLRGSVKIRARVAIDTDAVVLHVGKYLEVKSATINDTNADEYTVTDMKYHEKSEKLFMKLNNSVPKGSLMTIAIQFEGDLMEHMIGFYKSSYVDKNGNLRWLAATQFQATHARHAFPCFDEPSFKATFEIKISRTSSQMTLSNTPRISTAPVDGTDYYWDSYSNDTPMSTYLVAFIVSDLKSLSNAEKNFTIWAQPGSIDQAKYALDIGQKAIKYFATLFNQPYQLDKMDMVAVPDFAGGAMENWGLITYRESRLLYDPIESSDVAQQTVAAVIVHESTHMWFGNLVTPEWWGDLWLSEAFARYYQYFATAKIEPNWGLDLQFVVDQIHTAFATDSVDSSKPLSRHVESQAEVGTTGDLITYNKGASIVRMMDLVLGTSQFNPGLRDYLVARQYNSATPEHLWTSLQNNMDPKIANLKDPLRDVMNSWTTQPGFPVVHVTVTADELTISQERFLLRNPKNSPTNATWLIPLTWTVSSERDFHSTNPKYWLKTQKDTVNLKTNADEWLIVNIQQSGFYRVNYDEDSWYRIIRTLNSENLYEIHEINRAALMDDLMNLARAEMLDYRVALDGLQYVKYEINYLPFKAALNGLEYLNRRFAGGEHDELMKKFILKLMSKAREDLGYDDRKTDEHLDILLRAELNNWACKLNEKSCIKGAMKYFNDWVGDQTKLIPKNHRTSIYCTAVRTGTPTEWRLLKEKYLRSNCATEQSVILSGLACTQNKTLLESLLLSAVSKYKGFIREHDSTTVFSQVASSSLIGAEYILEFVAKHHTKMANYYGTNDTIASILSSASQHFSTPALVQKFEKFVTDNGDKLEPIRPQLNTALDLAKFELNWYNANSRAIAEWIKIYNERVEETTTAGNDISTVDFDRPPATPAPPDAEQWRLPGDVIPKKYTIKVTPYLGPKDFTFDGVVSIIASVVKSVDTIVMNTNELEYVSIECSVNGKKVEVKSHKVDKEYQRLEILLAAPLPVQAELVIDIEYKGTLNTAMKGFYRSSYKDDKNQTRWLAATHLEPVGARKMFPCFDEPALKAIFELSVSRPKDLTAISNTPLKFTVADGDRMLDTFTATPTMSTYLLALVVSDFESITDHLTYGAFARPNAIDQAKYAVSVMQPVVKFFETSLNIPYTLNKLDMVALPDFTSGAMENWGLITYRETNMLYDQMYSAITSKQAIINVIAHEVSHQWFGNLVSPHWWKYLWLSEGFARYFQYHATAKIETTWGLESQFVVDHLQTSFATDGLPSSHPMSHDVYTPTEIAGIFDVISYAKSASVIRMMEKTFGSEAFYKSLFQYLMSRQLASAAPEHLFSAFETNVKASNQILDETVQEIMETWTDQPGFPVVSVKITDGVATLSQERFLLKNPDGISIQNGWKIPITWTSKSNPDFVSTVPKFWLKKATDEVTLKIAEDDWVIFNVQQAGYYRVNYDQVSWSRIIDALKSTNFTSIHEVNRASIIDDLLNLARTDYTDYFNALSATEYLKHETNYIPWRAAFNGLSYLNKKFAGSDVEDLYKKHVQTILMPIYEKLGFDEPTDETHLNKLLRKWVINWACEFEVGDCVNKSIELFAKWLNDEKQMAPVDLRNTIYCTAIKKGTVDDWYFLWEKYLSAPVASEQVVILGALGCSQDRTRLIKFLTEIIAYDSYIRLQDSATAFAAVYNSGVFGAKIALEFVKDNYAQFLDRFGNYGNIETIVSGAAAQFTTKELVSYFETFVQEFGEKLPAVKKSLDSSLNKVKEELEWYYHHSPSIRAWLVKNYGSKDEDYRLPTAIKPVAYDVYITPYFENFTFDGEARIDMRVEEETSVVVLHTNRLTISHVEGYVSAVEMLGYHETTWDETTHKYTIYLTKTLRSQSRLSLHFKYSGVINSNMEGFYRSWYKDDAGQKRWLLTTQFQKVGARQAFPCFDEPSFKAKFTINIERPSQYHSLSNLPLLNSVESERQGRIWDTYEESVPMSSYLVAFIISDFANITNENTNFGIWSRPNAIEVASYSRNIGEKSLKYLETYTGVDYPLSKMDLVAIPDFAAGAMENWGLVTFRESGLLDEFSTGRTSAVNYVNTIISHELVHMWFGNLVTCDWWEYLWLNEGFAEYFQYVAIEGIDPDWKAMDQFAPYELQKALLGDVYSYVRPMNNKMKTPYDTGINYSLIAYAKSASVIHMLRHAFGETIFKQGLHYYLSQNKYSTGTPDKLWRALQQSANENAGLPSVDEPVAQLMDTWASQPGYPVVHVSLNKGELSLRQERFFVTRDNTTANSVWWIPISVQTPTLGEINNGTPAFWFGTQNHSVQLNIPNEWYILNVRQTGYYRVNYDATNWKRLSIALNSQNFSGIHELNRGQIIDDLFNLARADYVSYKTVAEVMTYLKKEQDHLPWKSFFNGAGFVMDRFAGNMGRYFRDQLNLWMTPVYNRLGFEEKPDESISDKMNREIILYNMCQTGDGACIIKAMELFDKWKKTGEEIPKNAKKAVYCMGVKWGDYSDWLYLWNHYLTTNSEAEKVTALSGLGCSLQASALDEYLRAALSSDLIRDHNVNSVYSSVYTTSVFSVDFMIDYLMYNYEAISKAYGGWNTVSTVFAGVSSKISKQEQYDKLEKFVRDSERELVKIKDDVERGLEEARRNLAWYTEHQEEFFNIFQNPPSVPVEVDDDTDAGIIAAPVNALLIVSVIATVFRTIY